MKILTKQIKEKLINQHKVCGHGEDGQCLKPIVKLFGGSACTWLLSELDPDTNIAFALCDLGMGTPELGYVSLEELKSLKFPLMALKFAPFGLPIERDLHWEAEKSLWDYASESRRLGFIQA